MPFPRIFDEVLRILIDDTIAVENDEFQGAVSLAGQFRQVGNAVHGELQRCQQT